MSEQADIVLSKISWLFEVASRIESVFKSQSTRLLDDVEIVCKKNNALYARGCIACDGHTYMILSNNPKQLLIAIVEHLKATNSEIYQATLNPTMIYMKLASQEFMLDTNGNRLCYAVKADYPSNYLMKAIACRSILTAHSFGRYIDPESNTMVEEMIRELHPLFDYRINANRVAGGRKKAKGNHNKKKQNARVDIIFRLMQHVRNNSTLAKGIIFASDTNADSAINIVFTDRKFKEAIESFINELVKSSFTKYASKCFLHAEFAVPYNFRMRKYSILLNEKATKFPTYIANMYNIGAYAPMPCIRSIVRDTFVYKAHPLVNLMILYIDMYSLERKTKAQQLESQDKVYMTKLMKAYNDVLEYDKSPTWVGIYTDEQWEKNKYNQKMKAGCPPDNYII